MAVAAWVGRRLWPRQQHRRSNKNTHKHTQTHTTTHAKTTQVPLRDFMWPFLEKRYYAIPRLIVEISYNLVHSLGQHSYDADCRLFLSIFAGDCEEAVRGEQEALARDVLTALRLVDVSVNQRATGWLHKKDVKAALSGFFARGGKRVERVDEAGLERRRLSGGRALRTRLAGCQMLPQFTLPRAQFYTTQAHQRQQPRSTTTTTTTRARARRSSRRSTPTSAATWSRTRGSSRTTRT